MSELPNPLTSISVSEALDSILSNFSALSPVEVDLEESLGLVLAEDVYSDIAMPPFDNSSMDGYAVRAEDVAGASPDSPAGLRVVGYLPAGAAPGPDDRVAQGEAFRIMTGAPMPPGADAVVPFEETSEGRGLRTSDLQPGESRAAPVSVGSEVLVYKRVDAGAYVRRTGEDVEAGALVLPRGKWIRPAEVGVLAAVGKSKVLVHRRPRAVVLATGDELVGVSERPGPGQIRNSNNFAVGAQLSSWGAEVHNLGVARDTKEHLTGKLQEALAFNPDLIVTSAGVSVGDYDVVKEVLMEMGRITMWRVRLRPGKPLAFGHLANPHSVPLRGPLLRTPHSNVPFLGLPGNPVSSMVAMELFARPAIMKMLGKENIQRRTIQARALEPLDNPGGREHYMRGIVTREGHEYVARLAGKQESNILTGMSRANAFLIVGEQTPRIEPGDTVQALMLDWPEEVF
jgi:molybdopterin molybdotransferase